MMIRDEIEKLIKKSLKARYGKEIEIKIEQPAEAVYGDYATNIAMILKKNPQEIAESIKSDIFEKVEVKNSFINFFLSKEYLQKQVENILKEKESFGELRTGRGQKVNVEFISANPTGPLTLGNGRGGFCGDVLANILEKTGYKVTREYYINDVGEQIKKLGHSVIDDSEAVYKGKYIDELKEKIEGKDPEKVGRKAAKFILEKNFNTEWGIKKSIKEMGIKFDTWFYESDLYKKKELDKTLEELEGKNLLYKKEGAVWFKSTKFGDDKDRVLIKADGEKTYFLSDIAYLKNKFKRGFQKLIFFWGTDHHGYINRIKAASEALGYKREQLDIIIMQLVAIMWSGCGGPEEVVRMSKREGIYRTIKELIEGLKLDVVRFFFLNRSPGTHLTFDLNLAKQQSEKNPVYYVQYAYTRICSILRKSPKYRMQNTKYQLLSHPSELNLIKQLIRLPEIIADTSRDYQVQRLPQYAMNLATVFHQFYQDRRVISEDKELTKTRLSLIEATKIVLKNTLDLMGISAPEKM